MRLALSLGCCLLFAVGAVGLAAEGAEEEIQHGDIVALATAKAKQAVRYQSTIAVADSRRRRRSFYDRRRRRRVNYARRRRTAYARRRAAYVRAASASSVKRDCEVSNWSAFTACTATCRAGLMGRTRSVTQRPMYGGVVCPRLAEVVHCNLGPCPTGCQVSPWGSFSSCTKSCGKAGTMIRRREVVGEVQYGKVTCPFLKEKRACNSNSCPVDCQMTNWWSWSRCTQTCGGGTRLRMRMAARQDTYGGKPCGPTQETGSCAFFECAQDCAIQPWTPWTSCSASCGGGSQSRSRVNTAARFGGRACPSAVQTRDCNAFPCPIDGGWTDWGAWGACSASCEGGEQARVRRCASPAPEFGGKDCDARHNADNRSCNMHLCYCPTCDAIAYRGAYKIRVNHFSAHHPALAQHGPRTVERKCAGFAKAGACAKTFVMAHRCAYNLHDQKCECKCLRPDAGQARDSTAVVADTSCVGNCLRVRLAPERAAQKALADASAAARKRAVSEKHAKDAAKDAAKEAAQEALEAAQAADRKEQAALVDKTEKTRKEHQRAEVAAAALKAFASP